MRRTPRGARDLQGQQGGGTGAPQRRSAFRMFGGRRGTDRRNSARRFIFLFQSKQLLEFTFGEDRDGQLFGLVVLRSWVGAYYYVIGFLAYRAGDFGAVLHH